MSEQLNEANSLPETPSKTGTLVARPTIHRGQSSDATLCCPGCGCQTKSSTSRFPMESVRGTSEFLRCDACHAYFSGDEYQAEVEEQHTRQMAWGEEDRGTQLNQFKRKMYRSILDGIEREGFAGSSLLDVGCSFGGFLTEANKRGFQVSGADIVGDAVDYCRRQGHRAEQCASLEDCSLFSETAPADVVTVLDAHIYWPDQPRELRAAWRMLKDDGLLVIRAIAKSPFITAGRVMQSVAPGFGKNLIRRAITDHRFSQPLPGLIKTIEAAGFDVTLATPKGAVHSDESGLGVRMAFAVGAVTWHSFGIPLAPGALIFARKRNASA